MKPSDILKIAKDKLINKGWTQGAYARSGLMSVAYDSKHADSFCPLGAIYSVIDYALLGTSYLQDRYATTDAISYLHRATGYDGTIPNWNDQTERTKEQVIAAFDKAIELAESDGQ
jgi:hypothetical protein